MSLSTIVYTALLLAYFVIMYLTPERDPSPEDKKIEGEERFIKFAIALNFLWLFSLSTPYYTPPLARLDPLYAAIAGAAVFGLGIAVRTIAIRNLGRHFTYQLTIRQEHSLITNGIHKYVRHPSYTGTLLEVIGMMIAARSWVGMLVFFCSGGVIIGIRIFREERMLREHFGEEYDTYCKRSKRLIPFVW